MASVVDDACSQHIGLPLSAWPAFQLPPIAPLSLRPCSGPRDCSLLCPWPCRRQCRRCWQGRRPNTLQGQLWARDWIQTQIALLSHMLTLNHLFPRICRHHEALLLRVVTSWQGPPLLSSFLLLPDSCTYVLYPFPRASVTKYHSLKWFSHSSGG